MQRVALESGLGKKVRAVLSDAAKRRFWHLSRRSQDLISVCFPHADKQLRRLCDAFEAGLVQIILCPDDKLEVSQVRWEATQELGGCSMVVWILRSEDGAQGRGSQEVGWGAEVTRS